MRKIYFILALVCYVTYAHAQFPQIKWWYDTHDASFGQSAAGDIDGDGKLEMVFGCYRNDSSIYALNGENGTLLWKYNAHVTGAEGCNDVAPVIYDVDGDDSLEVIVPSSCNPKTFCFKGLNGTIEWQTATAGSDSPPTVADIDNDGKPEILHGGFDGKVLCINAENGSVSWSQNVFPNSWIQTAPTILDVDGNGQLDFVVASWAFSPDTSKVYAFRGDNHSLIWSKAIPDVMYHGTAVADFEKDGKPELVIGAYDGKLYMLNAEDGSDVWSYQANYYIGAPAVIADLDDNGICDIIYCDAWGVGALTALGSPMWYYEIPQYATAFRGVAIADINGDEMPDVAFGTSKGRLIVLNGTNGTEIWSLDLAAHYGDTLEFDHAPLIADFDKDGTIDIYIVGGFTKYPDFQNNYGRAYMISAGNGQGPEWLMFQHDVQRQSSLCAFSPSVVQPASITEDEISLYPNPVSDKLYINTDVRIDKLSIHNTLGQLLLQKNSNFNVAIDLSSFKNGMYLILIESYNSLFTKKFIIQNDN
ncbi:MAG: FG-GAP-like repeat-containing protein [Bacteroidales bacterium]|nr:FG-GAP-like repeat-containing protein [Bacteroidales bacterium]